MKTIRVWCIVNPPNHPRFYYVDTTDQAIWLIDILADEQLTSDEIVSNCFGIEEYDEQDNEWWEIDDDY